MNWNWVREANEQMKVASISNIVAATTLGGQVEGMPHITGILQSITFPLVPMFIAWHDWDKKRKIWLTQQPQEAVGRCWEVGQRHSWFTGSLTWKTEQDWDKKKREAWGSAKPMNWAVVTRNNVEFSLARGKVSYFKKKMAKQPQRTWVVDQGLALILIPTSFLEVWPWLYSSDYRHRDD